MSSVISSYFQISIQPSTRRTESTPNVSILYTWGPHEQCPQHSDACGGLIYANVITSPFLLKYCPLLLEPLTSTDQQQEQSTRSSSEIKHPKNYFERCRRVSSSISERVEACLQRDGSHLPFKVTIKNVISSNDETCSFGRCN